MRKRTPLSILRPKYLGAFLLGVLILLTTIAVASPQGHSTTQAEAAIPSHPSGGGIATPTPTCGPVWGIQYGPNAGNHYNRLAAVDDAGTGHPWAVGYSQDDGAVTLPVAQYWDGSQWTVSATPPMTESGYLTAVDARTAGDVWAVGYSYSVQGRQTLTMHWDGAQWSLVPSPNRGQYQFDNYLTGVTAVSANDVWAVGYYYNITIFRYATLTEHWDGTSWRAVDSPNALYTANNYLRSVSAVSANDIWAVGYYQAPGQYEPLTLHWDGSSWNLVDVTVPPGYSYFLNSVSAYSTNEVWAVGTYQDGPNQYTFDLRWDGTAWHFAHPPNPSIYTNQLYGVKVLSPGDVWAVGTYGTGPSGQDAQTLTLHWGGTSWDVVPSANGAARDNYLNSVAASSSGELWSVGSYAPGGVTYALTLRYPSDSCTTPTITYTPTPIILPSRTPTPTYTPSCGLGWRVVPSANTLGNINYLNNLGLISENDIWAIGTNLQHWDGTRWTIMPNASGGTGISGSASNDVWLVGTESGGSANTGNTGNSTIAQGGSTIHVPPPVATTPPGYRTLTDHWDGSQWTRIPSPNPDSFFNFLAGVTVIAPNDAWAIGYYRNPGSRTLALHWDGQAWTVVPSSNSSNGATILQSVHANSTNDVWAAGYSWNSSLGREQYFIIHWDGQAWTISYSPPTDPNANNHLIDIGGTGPDDMWAVGTAILHWNGSQWTETPNPVTGGELRGVAALAPDDVWVTGSTGNILSQEQQTVALHWDGTKWTRVPSPNPDPNSSALYGVAAAGPHSIWTVGYMGLRLSGSISRTLIEHYSDPCSQMTSTPTPYGSATATSTRAATGTATGTAIGTATGTATGTPPVVPSVTLTASRTSTGTAVTTVTAQATHTSVALTRTPTPGVVTSTATATSCAIQFSDVPVGSTFYTYVRCLACLGIINGYPDGTFKPNNNVTRGQLSKIVSNAAGFSDSQTTQMFQDVPVGSTFQVYIGRLASRGFINGYACGGVGEPCGPGNLPYFRPGNNATRGQISKIDSNAAEFNDTPSGQQFEDVLVGSTYYTYTYRLVSRGVMGGYPCGGVGEPCVPPGNLPYFRPGKNATRGQTSKIVSNTFFPDCNLPTAIKP